GSVDLFVKIAGLALGTGERGDDEARIGLVFCPFRLRHDPALATPAAPRHPPEVLEAPRRLAGTPALRRSPLKLGLDFGDEPIGFRQPEVAADNTKERPNSDARVSPKTETGEHVVIRTKGADLAP